MPPRESATAAAYVTVSLPPNIEIDMVSPEFPNLMGGGTKGRRGNAETPKSRNAERGMGTKRRAEWEGGAHQPE